MGRIQKNSFNTLAQDLKNQVSIEKNALRTETKILAIALIAIIRTDIILIKTPNLKFPT